jgi:predicted RNA-binding Zn-ribbon protein involved in translation (DUF1610 family)
MCDPCQIRLGRELGWLVMDFVTLKTLLPSPIQHGSRTRHNKQQSFGHPASDASDACSEIAWLLNSIESGLRAHVGDLPAPDLIATYDRHEIGYRLGAILVNHAHRYLSAHFEQLCDWPEVGYHADAIHDTHQTNRSKYGLTRFVEPRMPMPCPNCDLAMLARCDPKIDQPTSYICGSCGRKFAEDEYLTIARMTIAWRVHVYEAELRAPVLRQVGGLIRALAAARALSVRA